MSRGTTRRSALGRRTRTLPNSSRSVTKASPSGPPTNPPLRLRPTSAMAPGGGGSARVSTIATGWPASSSTSTSLGAWSLAMTRRAPSSSQVPTASARRAVRPGGRVGSRQPKGSPELRSPAAIATSRGASDSQVSSRVRDATRRPFQSRGGRYVGGHSRGRSPAVVSSPRRSSAWRHSEAAASAMSPGSSSTRSVPTGMWSNPVAGARNGAQISAASPTARAREPDVGAGASRVAAPAASRVADPGSTAGRSGSSDQPSKRARSEARRSPSLDAARPRRSRIAATPVDGSRNSDAGSSTALSMRATVRWSVGSKARSESISSPNDSTRMGRSSDGGKMSTIPPRLANSPRPATSMTGL